MVERRSWIVESLCSRVAGGIVAGWWLGQHFLGKFGPLFRYITLLATNRTAYVDRSFLRPLPLRLYVRLSISLPLSARTTQSLQHVSTDRYINRQASPGLKKWTGAFTCFICYFISAPYRAYFSFLTLQYILYPASYYFLNLSTYPERAFTI